MSEAGYNTTVKLGTNLIDGINNCAFDGTLDQLDTSKFNIGHRTFIPGLSQANMTISGDHIPGDTNGQVALIAAWKAKTLLTSATAPEFLVDGTHGFSADAYVSNIALSSTVEGKAIISVSLQLTGEVTIT